MLNPFSFFSRSNGLSNWDLFPEPEGVVASFGSGLVDFISGIYDQLQDMAWTALVPLFFAVLLFEILMVKNADKGDKIKAFVKRVVFIGIGAPICAALYTAVLANLTDITSNKTAGQRDRKSVV